MSVESVAKALTEKQREVLQNLYGEDDGGLTPMFFGGSDASHHSNTARALCMKEPPLVERRPRGLEWGARSRRGPYRYRLTSFGNRVAEALGFKSYRNTEGRVGFQNAEQP